MTSGVYCITNLKNGKVYIGSAVSIKRRRDQHFCLLRAGDHPNKHLQAAYLKYGEKNFVFETLELVGKRSLRKREQHWLNQKCAANKKYGYNNSPHADRPRNYRWSDAQRQAQSKRRRGVPWTATRCSAQKKNPHFTMPRSAVRKSRKARLLRFVVFSPANKRYEVSDLKPFCVKHKLRYENMIGISNGWPPHHYKKWRCYKLRLKETDAQAISRTEKLAIQRDAEERKRRQAYYQKNIDVCRARCRAYSKIRIRSPN